MDIPPSLATRSYSSTSAGHEIPEQEQQAKRIAEQMENNTFETHPTACPFNWRKVKVIPGTTISPVSKDIYLSRDFVDSKSIKDPADEHGKSAGENHTLKNELIKKGLEQESLSLSTKFEFIYNHEGQVAVVNLNNKTSDTDALENHNTHLKQYGINTEKFTLEPGTIEKSNNFSIHNFVLKNETKSVAYPVIRPSNFGFADCLHNFDDLLSFFKEVYPEIHDKIVLVNCNQGLSRSSTLSILIATTNAVKDQGDYSKEAISMSLSAETEKLMTARFEQGPGALDEGFPGMMIHVLDHSNAYFSPGSKDSKLADYATNHLGFYRTGNEQLEPFMKDRISSIRDKIVETISDIVETSGMARKQSLGVGDFYV